MATQIVSVVALLASVAFLLVANGLHGLLLPLRASAEHFSTNAIGLVGAGWAAGFILGCLYTPHMVRAAGHVRAFGAATATAAIIALLSGLFVNPVMWVVFRAFSGFALAACFMIVESWLNDRATNESRGTLFGVYMTITYVGILGGQFLLAGVGVSGTTPFMLAAVFFCLAVLPTALSTAPQPRPLTRARLDLKGLVRHSPVSCLTVFLVGAANGAFGNLAPVFAAHQGLDTALVALMMSAAIVAGAVMQMPIGRLSDRLPDRRYALASAAFGAAGVGIALAVLDPSGPAAILSLTLLYGALAYTLYSVAVAHANDHAGPDDFVGVSGGLLLRYGFGTMLGPIAGAAVMGAGRAASLFAVTAACHLTIGAYTLYRMTRRAPVPRERREAFQTQPSQKAQTPETAALDPRAERDGAERDGAERDAAKGPKRTPPPARPPQGNAPYADAAE